MATREEINAVLRRPLKAGGERYNSLFPSVSCKVFKTGHGDPKYILDFMKSVAVKHANQLDKLTPVLVGKTLKETTVNFYNFLYENIQYNVDGYDQHVLSPACAWHNRFKGMDCKSFTTFAAALCAKAGITSYLRQIKQYNGDRVSHVYLVVPVDQQTGSLNKGHYIIDATTHDNQEVAYTWKNDLKMEKLPVYGMNAPGMGCDCTITQPTGMGALLTGMHNPYKSTPGMGLDPMTFSMLIGAANSSANSSSSGGDPDDAAQAASILDAFSIVGSVIPGFNDILKYKSLTCTQSWYDDSWQKSDINNFTSFFQGLESKIKQNVQQNNLVELSKNVTDILGYAKIIEKSFREKRAPGWRSKCTEARLDMSIKYGADLVKSIENTLLTNLAEFYNYNYSGKKQFTSDMLRPLSEFRGSFSTHNGPVTIIQQDIFQFTNKPNVVNPNLNNSGLVFNNAAASSGNSGLGGFLNSLSGLFGSGLNNAPNSNTVGGINEQGFYDPNYTPTKNSSVGIVVVIILILIGGGAYYYKTKSPQKVAAPVTSKTIKA